MITHFKNFVQAWIDKKESQLYEQGDIFLHKLGSHLWDATVVLTPEIVGLSALLIGGWVMIHPMISNDPITKPLGIFGAVFIIGASIMSYALRGA